MTLDLDDRLRAIFSEIADSTAVENPTRVDPARLRCFELDREVARPRPGRWIAVAATSAAVGAVVVGGPLRPGGPLPQR